VKHLSQSQLRRETAKPQGDAHTAEVSLSSSELGKNEYQYQPCAFCEAKYSELDAVIPKICLTDIENPFASSSKKEI
jgi:hypothetical protein